MKVKYKQSYSILSCFNSDFHLDIQTSITKVGTENRVLYDPLSVLKFVDSICLDFTNLTQGPTEYDGWINKFLYQGCCVTINNKLLVTAVGLKHFLSSFLAVRLLENKLEMELKNSKFVNWFLKFDFDAFVLKANNLLHISPTCKFCDAIGNDKADNSFCKNNPEVVKHWRRKATVSGEPLKETDDQLDFLMCLAKVAGRELGRMILHDNKISGTKSQKASLAIYDPEKDWESSSPLIKLFIEEIMPESICPLIKVTFRNNIFLGNQTRFFPYKPQSCYFVSSIIKYLHDKKKILNFLSTIGIGVGCNPVNNLEKNQIDLFNADFWTIPENATVSAVMDNNQADFSSKSFNPLNDSHHVDCLNVLQVIKPSGNSNLIKESKSIENLDSTFIDSTFSENEAGNYFYNSFNTMLIKHFENQPTSTLKNPTIQDILPCGGGQSALVPDFIVKFFKEDGNVLKNYLLDGPRYGPYNLSDPTDPMISWDNKSGSKTCLRYLKIGKSTDDHVFLDSLAFLYNNFKTIERQKIFITLDQALHFKYKNLLTRKKMPNEYIDFFIVILDPFHHQWCLLKCFFSAYENAGLKDLVAIFGIDEKKWPNLLGESKNVHKAQEILEVISISLGIFFVNFYLERLSALEKADYELKDLSEKAKWISDYLPTFLEEVASIDKSLSVYVELYKFSVLVIQCWESQRVANFDMYMHSIKETLPFLFSFNRFNYQQSTVEFLSDIALLGSFYTDLLKSGIMFESLSHQPGKQVSCGYILEIYNKIIKQLTPNIDSTGSGWLRNLPRLSFIKQILLNASNAKLFSESEKDPITKKCASIELISKLRWVLEIRNIFNIDDKEFSITPREAVHIFNGQKIDMNFIECKLRGKEALDKLVSKVISKRPIGSIDYLRKELNLKKIVPFQSKKKYKPKLKASLSKTEKQTLLNNYSDEDIPIVSFSMLSPTNNNTPYIGGNKSDSGKFILDKYAGEIRMEYPNFDLTIVDFMPLIFSQPPSQVYTEKLPLEAFCNWMVSTYIKPYLETSSRVILCIDRKNLEDEYPLKSETHKLRKNRSDGQSEFVKLLSLLLNNDVKVVSESYIPPFSWILSNREIRFELIFKMFDEIFKHPSKYSFPPTNFQLIVDGFKDCGKALQAMVLNHLDGKFSVNFSEFTVTLPEADQTIFYMLKKFEFDKCLILFRDNDILLSAILNYKQICSFDQSIYLQNIGTKNVLYDVSQVYKCITEDPSLAHFTHPVETLVFSFLAIGNNDYSGKLWGMSVETAYKSLKMMTKDLACRIDQNDSDELNFSTDHLFTLFASKCIFSISKQAFDEFIKLLYIQKNLVHFKDKLCLPLPKNIQLWKKDELIAAFDLLNINRKTMENGKPMSVLSMKKKLLSHTESNVFDKQRLDTYLSKGELPHKLDYSFVQKCVWLNKNQKDWCPSLYQIKNMYGRSILTSLLFSIPDYFPPKTDLVKFGYNINFDQIAFNLKPSVKKLKNVRTLLSAQLRKKDNAKKVERKGKRTVAGKITNTGGKKRKPNSPERLID